MPSLIVAVGYDDPGFPDPEIRFGAVRCGGGFGPADPALDLVAARHLLADEPRKVLRAAPGYGDVEISSRACCGEDCPGSVVSPWRSWSGNTSLLPCDSPGGLTRSWAAMRG